MQRYEEAAQLDRTLRALDLALQRSAVTATGLEHSDNAIAICCSARFLLSEMYACNERYDGIPTGQEAEMQKMALRGIEESVDRAYHLALRLQNSYKEGHDTASFLTAHCLYWAASECAWYIKEGRHEAVQVSETLKATLRIMNRRWHIAG
jgi:hypothetical protein